MKLRKNVYNYTKSKYGFVWLYGSGEGQLNNCNCNMALNC